MERAPFTFHTIQPRTTTQHNSTTTLLTNTAFPLPAPRLVPDSPLLVGVSFDDEPCSEHEGGINPLKKALGIKVPYHQRHTATPPDDISLCSGPALDNIHLARIETEHYGHVFILCAGHQPTRLSSTQPPAFLSHYAQVRKATAYWDSDMFAIALPVSNPDTPLLFQLYALLLQGSCHLFSTFRVLPTAPDNWGLFSPTLANSVWTGRIRNASRGIEHAINKSVVLHADPQK